jgi:hypothetical protein
VGVGAGVGDCANDGVPFSNISKIDQKYQSPPGNVEERTGLRKGPWAKALAESWQTDTTHRHCVQQICEQPKTCTDEHAD